ncbi:MAG TPA: cache domain-containing protein [Dongiaceae bacterium]|nr:cache domain-containing protein [Dongiaceae bacterium]
MAAGNQVVDVAVDPRDLRDRRRRAWRRMGIPIVAVVLMVAAIVVAAVVTFRENRQGVLVLTDNLLKSLDDQIAAEVAGYLVPAGRVVRIMRDMLGENALTHPQDAESIGATALREIPQIAYVSFADQDGNYILVRRRPGGGTEVQIIENASGPRRVTWIYRDATGAEIGRKEDPSETYDPRRRPWYIGAEGTDQLFWTDAYVFYTGRKPGITVSARYRGADGRIYVYGVDIFLDELSRFLASLQIGRRGKAIIMDSSGDVVASPAGNIMVDQGNGNFVAAKVDALGDPAFTRAYDHFRAEGAGRQAEEVNGQPYIVTITPLTTGGRDWFIVIAAPVEDFAGFIVRSSRNALIISLVIILIATALAVLFVRQGLRADCSARILAEHQRVVGQQTAAFARIATDLSEFDRGRGGLPGTVTESLVEVTAGRRASVLRLLADGRLLTSEDAYHRDSGGHTSGTELHRDELPQFIAALEKGENFSVSDAAKDRRTAELYRIVMESYGTRALLVVPIRREESTIGAILVEDWAQDPSHREAIWNFVPAVAQLLASRATEAPEPPGRSPVAPAAQTPKPELPEGFTPGLEDAGIGPNQAAEGVYPHAAVMVLQLTDMAAMALRANGDGRTVADEILCSAQKFAEEHRIPHLKLVGDELFAAAGLGGQSDGAPARIADVALSIRDRCMDLFEEMDRAPAFRIGVDCGPAMGSRLGTSPEIFNLWGDAVKTAANMASSALPSTVQVTEATYRRLRRDFLFRPRGRFYLPRVGEAQTFILASQS